LLVSHWFAVEAMYLYHGIVNAHPTTAYSDVLGGIRFHVLAVAIPRAAAVRWRCSSS
jgi:hypothetical protein